MIVSRIWAGLGNQLFQYAAGKSLATFHKTTFKMDPRWYSLSIFGETVRRYELDVFNICAEIASEAELQNFPFTTIPKLRLARSFLPRWQTFLQKKKPHSHLRSYRELNFHFDPCFFELPANVYLVGYFQSERYFKQIERQIRKEFTFKIPPSLENQLLLEKMRATPAVSLHVRRGDYLLNRRIHLHHGLCDFIYYKQAIQEIEKRIVNPHFYVFSDDIPWIQANLLIDHPIVFVTHNQGVKSYEDLRLMSHCQHHIIANSSFSWWGAWLNPQADKIVIAPKKWTNVKLNFSDLIPTGWILL